LQLFIEGVALFSSSNVKIYPVFGYNLSIPFEHRYDLENVFLLGVCSTAGCSNLQIFLKYMVKQLNKWQNQGLNISIGGHSVDVKVLPICFVGDTEAREDVLCLNRGRFRYSHCYIHGESFGSGSVTYPSRPTDLIMPRSQHSFLFDSSIIKNMPHKTHFRGIQGGSTLLDLANFSFPAMFPIDIMDVVYLGVVKDFILMWLGIRNLTYVEERWIGGKPWVFNEKNKQEFLNDLENIKFPCVITRSARLDIEHWKAVEFATFLLHSSLPLISGRLPEQYIAHWKLLVEAISILCKPVLHVSEIEIADSKLKGFVDLVPILY
jgi:hypothetical protein